MIKFITDSNKLHNCVIFLTLLLLISSCSDQKEVDNISIKNNSLAKEKEQNQKEANALSKAIKLAQNNKSEGLIKIYKIASTTISAEHQEIADSVLRERFLKNPDLWIKTFATEDLTKLKKDIRFSGIVDLVDDPNLSKDIRIIVVNRLKFYSKKKETSELASYILQINNLK